MRSFALGITDVTADQPAETLGAVLKLKKLGHAIEITSASDSSGKLLNVTVCHYRTCRSCAEIKKE